MNSYRCHNCGSIHENESIRRNLCYGQLAIGDMQAFRRGGALSIGRCLVCRKVIHALIRGLCARPGPGRHSTA